MSNMLSRRLFTKILAFTPILNNAAADSLRVTPARSLAAGGEGVAGCRPSWRSYFAVRRHRGLRQLGIH